MGDKRVRHITKIESSCHPPRIPRAATTKYVRYSRGWDFAGSFRASSWFFERKKKDKVHF